MSTENISSSSTEKKSKPKDRMADDAAEITDRKMNDGKGPKNEEITDNTKNDDNGEKEKQSNEDKKGDTESMSSLVENVKSKETEIQNNDEKR